jgi:hypothetical protein
MKQGKLKPLEFYHTVVENLNLQTSFIKMHLATTATVLIDNSQKLALRVFLKGLNGQIGDYLSTRNPPNLNTALHILTNDFNVSDREKTVEPKTFKSPPQYPPFNKQNPQRPFYQNPFNQFNRPFANPRPINNNYLPTPMSVSTRNTFKPRAHTIRTNSRFKPMTTHYEETHNIEEKYNHPREPQDNYFLGQKASDRHLN